MPGPADSKNGPVEPIAASNRTPSPRATPAKAAVAKLQRDGARKKLKPGTMIK